MNICDCVYNLHVVPPGSHGVSAVNFPWNIFDKAVHFHLQIFLVEWVWLNSVFLKCISDIYITARKKWYFGITSSMIVCLLDKERWFVKKQGKKVCKTTAVQCYRCSLRLMLFLALRVVSVKTLTFWIGQRSKDPGPTFVKGQRFSKVWKRLTLQSVKR